MIVPRAAAAALIGVSAAALVLASSASITVYESDRAILRLAWSARPERIERCRQLRKEELERLPAHMRQPVICEGASAEYRLTVRLDGVAAAERIVRGGGLRHDRRIYVFEEIPLDPGDAVIDVTFERVDADEAVNAPQPPGQAVPARMVFTQRFDLRPREVILVTYSPDRRALEGIRGPVR